MQNNNAIIISNKLNNSYDIWSDDYLIIEQRPGTLKK